MKFKVYCRDCEIEAIIEVTDNPWDADPEEMINNCFHCGSNRPTVEQEED